jgi:hypothetical protein
MILTHRELMSVALLASAWNLTRWVESRVTTPDVRPLTIVQTAWATPAAPAAPKAGPRAASAPARPDRTAPAPVFPPVARGLRPGTELALPSGAEVRGVSPAPSAPRS